MEKSKEGLVIVVFEGIGREGHATGVRSLRASPVQVQILTQHAKGGAPRVLLLGVFREFERTSQRIHNFIPHL